MVSKMIGLRFKAWHKKEKKMFNVKSIDWLVMTSGTHEIDLLHLVKIGVPDKTGIYCRIEDVELILC